jgi:hypothetical protein
MLLLVSGCKERKRVHPNMVSVHHLLQELSFIDLLEVGGGWSTLTRPFFGWMAFQKFSVADLELGG